MTAPGGVAPLLGVLGGMGPLATVDFLRKLIEETPAQRDAEHVPVVVYAVPQIPDRPAAILSGGASPLPAMLHGVRVLKAAGATQLAIACNTAHYWHDDLVREGGLPILHIADAACGALGARAHPVRRTGLIATPGTIAAGFFQQRLALRGVQCIVQSADVQQNLVLPAIAAVKRGDLAAAHGSAVQAVEALLSAGAEAVILACTEIPPALEHRPSAVRAACLDATRALARACVAWWKGASGTRSTAAVNPHAAGGSSAR